MSRIVCVLLCASLLSLAPQSPLRGAAAAEDASQAPLSADEPPARAVEYARRYLIAVKMEETINIVMEAFGPSLVEAEAARRPDLSASDKQIVLESVTESLAAIMPRFIDNYAVELAGILTESELRQMAEFYESPVGRSVTAKTKELSQASERAMMSLLPEITRELEQRLCRRIDCGGATLPAAQPS